MTTQEIHRPTGRSVWYGKDLLRSNDWAFHLPPRAIEEIDAALTRLTARGAALTAITRQDFPLESIAGDIARMKEEVGTGRGFAVIKGLPSAKYSESQLGMIFWGFGAHFGTSLPQSFLGERLADIRDMSDEIPERHLRRGYRSGGLQTSHTDANGDVGIVAMLSLCKAKSGGESRLVSAHTIHNLMLDHCPELLAVAYDGFVLRRPDFDAAAMGRPALIGKIPSFTHSEGWLNCDHQNGYMRRAKNAGDARLGPKEQAAYDVFSSFANHPDVMLEMMLEPGDFQFLNNRKILHGRANFDEFTEKELRRHLYRLWLHVPEWPKLPAHQGSLWIEDMMKWEAYAGTQKSATAAPAHS